MRIDLYVHIDGIGLDPRIDQILTQLTRIEKGELKLAKELDDLTAAVAQEVTIEQSAITLLNGLKTQLDAAILAASNGDPTKLNELSAQIGTSSSALAAAVQANTTA